MLSVATVLPIFFVAKTSVEAILKVAPIPPTRNRRSIPINITDELSEQERDNMTIRSMFCHSMNESDCKHLEKIYKESVDFENFLGILIPAIFCGIVLIGTLGNILVIIVAVSRQMRNSTNTLIIGLAISDLMFLLICIPITALDYATSTWILPEWTCSLINYCQHTSAYMSVWTLALMAFDRFLAVCYPVESMTIRTTKNTIQIMVGLYTVIAISQIPVAFLHGIYTYEFLIETRSACAYVAIVTEQASVFETVLYFCTFNTFGYIIPLGITSGFYFCMLRRLWHTPRPGTTSSVTSSVRSRPETVAAKRKATRLVLSVIVIWAACWFPINICFFVSAFTYPDSLVVRFGKAAVILQIGSQVLAYMNSCLNPLLYALMSENFRKGFLRVIAAFFNRLTRGLICNSDSRSNSRMEVTNFNGESIRRGRRNNTMKHTHSAPSCAESLPMHSQPEEDSTRSEIVAAPTERTSLLRGAKKRIVRAIQERNSIRFVQSTAAAETAEVAVKTDSEQSQEPSHQPSVNVSDAVIEIEE